MAGLVPGARDMGGYMTPSPGYWHSSFRVWLYVIPALVTCSGRVLLISGCVPFDFPYHVLLHLDEESSSTPNADKVKRLELAFMLTSLEVNLQSNFLPKNDILEKQIPTSYT